MSSLLWNRNSRTSHRCSSFSRLSGFWRDYSRTACPSENLCALRKKLLISARQRRLPFRQVKFRTWNGGRIGYLPHWYSNLTADRIRSGDATLRDFLRIFDHRFISLFYQAWERYRFPVAYERGDRDRFSHLLLHLVGMGTAGLNAPIPIEEEAFLFYSGVFAQRPRSAEALRWLLEDYFGVPAEINQFLGSWFALDEENVSQPGERETPSESLGGGMVIGDGVWDQQARARVRLGPLTLEQYRAFLPGQSGYRALQVLTRFFSSDEIDFELQLVLQRTQVPGCALS